MIKNSSLLYSLCLLFTMIFIYFSAQPLQQDASPTLAPTALYKKLDSSCEPVAQYRQDSLRSGASTATPSTKIKIKKHLQPFNVGVHGSFKSSPVVDDTGIYIGTDSGWFLKLSHSGEIIWRFYSPGSNNGVQASASVDDKKVYFGTYDGFVYALDKADGSVVWANLTADYMGASPLLAEKSLFVVGETAEPNSFLAKIDCNTGKTLWVSQWLGGHSQSSPVFDKANQSIVVGADSGRLYSFTIKDGVLNWDKQFHGQIQGSAAIFDQHVFFSSLDKNYHSLNLEDGSNHWTTFVGGRLQTSLALVPGSPIGITNTKTGDITALNLNDGSVLWRLQHGDRNGKFSLTITKSNEKNNPDLAWSRCKDFQLCILNAKTGKLLNNIDLPGSFSNSPYAFKNKLYISLDDDAGFLILE